MRRMPERTTLPVYILYVEFGHSNIPSFVSVANTIRGYKVSLSIVLQSLSQLAARYGPEYARTIQGGFNTWLTYAGADQTTAEYFEKIAGKVIEERRNRIEQITSQRREYNLLNADAVRRITDTQAIMVATNKNPALLETTPYFADRRLSKIPKRFGEAHIPAPDTRRKVSRVPLQ